MGSELFQNSIVLQLLLGRSSNVPAQNTCAKTEQFLTDGQSIASPTKRMVGGCFPANDVQWEEKAIKSGESRNAYL